MNEETQRLLDVIAEDDLTAVADNAEAFAAELRRLSEENTRLRAFWAVVDSYLARGGDAADYLPIDVLAAWQEAL